MSTQTYFPPQSEKEKSDSISYRLPGLERKVPTKSDLPLDQGMGIDFIVSIVVCSIVGALFDRAFKTFPLGFIIMCLLGGVMGALNILHLKHRGRK
jgi:F0F1-type ATP synthase assembly protein I